VHAIVTYISGGRSRRSHKFGKYYWNGRPERVDDPDQIRWFKKHPTIFTVVEKGLPKTIETLEEKIEKVLSVRPKKRVTRGKGGKI
jgi:hypothetical protein